MQLSTLILAKNSQRCIKYIQKCEFKDMMKYTTNILELFLNISLTSCSSGKAFSKLSIVNTKLRTTLTQDRLENHLFIFVTQGLAQRFSEDKIIENLKLIIPGKARLRLVDS